MGIDSIGLYIHIPWCIKKCPYCDFNSHTLGNKSNENQYIDSLLSDFKQDLSLLDSARTISSIFMGGGTPSLFSAAAFDRLFTGISRLVNLQEGLEITLEANPGTFDSNKFAEYRKIGINRLSIGIQSFNEAYLETLGRIHTAKEAIQAVKIAQQAGFDNLNLDLMFGLPGQNVTEMLTDIQTAINLNPNHLSFYQLTIEPNTFFYKTPPQLPRDELIFSGQKQCQQLLAEAGYQQYEVSAYAKNNAFCQHNINYWTFGDYLGIGAGAHGKITVSQPDNIIRTIKPKSPEHYLTNNQVTCNKIVSNELPVEFLMNQLRLRAGFDINHYEEVTGLGINTLNPALSACVEQGLLVKQKNHYFCSDRGWNFLDDILEKFIS